MNVSERITSYLNNGGLFNPEMMEHDKVRDLLIAARDEIERLLRELEQLRRNIVVAERVITRLRKTGERILNERVSAKEALEAAKSSGERWEEDFTALCEALGVEVTVEATDCAADQALESLEQLRCLLDAAHKELSNANSNPGTRAEVAKQLKDHGIL